MFSSGQYTYFRIDPILTALKNLDYSSIIIFSNIIIPICSIIDIGNIKSRVFKIDIIIRNECRQMVKFVFKLF